LGQHPIGDEIPRPLFNKKKHLRPVIDYKGEDITPPNPLNPPLRDREDTFVVKRTPIIKPTGVASNILDVLSVYHGKTVEQIEDIIMSKIRTARVDNKTLKHTSLFTVLKELVE
jgi:hypothetical protein